MLSQPFVRWRRGLAQWQVGGRVGRSGGALAPPGAGAVMVAELSPAACPVSIPRAGSCRPCGTLSLPPPPPP